MSCSGYKTFTACTQYLKCNCQWTSANSCLGLMDIKCLEQNGDIKYEDAEYSILFLSILALLCIIALILYVIRTIMQRLTLRQNDNDDIYHESEPSEIIFHAQF